MSASMAEVIRRHWSFSTHTENKPTADKCDGCGHVLHEWGTEGNPEDALAAHQEAELAANGYWKLEEAWDEGYTTGNAHNGRRDANPYRRPE